MTMAWLRCRLVRCFSRVVVLVALLPLLEAAIAAAAVPDPKDDPAGVAFFEQQVRPILVGHCYECHSAEAKIVQGGLLLDSRPGWQKGGETGVVIVPGKPAESLLVRALRYSEDEAVQMPPKGKLSDREIAVLTEWVARGAPDPRSELKAPQVKQRVIDYQAGRKHWAFQPLTAHEPPTVKNESWCRNPIDRFIVAAHEQHNVHGNASADLRTLTRRVHFDLLGLPPAVDDVNGKIDYEALIDRLLNSPHYGERWARHWLDLARFGESHGFEQDYDRPYAYHYRDFVIRALNADMPYDQFVRWQIAGDELVPDDPLALAATGFLGAGVHATQITANQAEKERNDELDDIVRTIGTTFLGLTVGCARCHDHKYDPIANTDYYRLVATFATTVRSNQYVDQQPQRTKQAWAEFESRVQPLVAERSAYERGMLAERFDAWLVDESRPRLPTWIVLTGATGKGPAPVETLPDGSLRTAASNTLGNDVRTINATADAKDLQSLRLEALADRSLPKGGPGCAPDGSFKLNELKLQVASADGKQQQTVVLRRLGAAAEKPESSTDTQPDAKPKKGAASPATAWNVADPTGRKHVAMYTAKKPFGFGPGSKLTFTLTFNGTEHGIGRLRLAVSAQAEPSAEADEATPAAVAALAQLAADPKHRLTGTEREALAGWQRTLDDTWRQLHQRVEALEAQQPWPDWARVMICSEGIPAIRLHTQGPDYYERAYQLRRGDPTQKVGEIEAGYLRVLQPSDDAPDRWREAPPAGSALSYRRRALANWLTDTQYGAGQLLARVIVNRLWYYHFGQGIVATPSDFGFNGAKPTHPELLDWLAGELIRNGWRLKPIHRLILTSATYRQTCAADAARLAADVDNRWLWHRPMQRLEAEAVRDALLAASGELDRTMFGPGTMDPAHKRRSVYFFVKRSKLAPMMTLFDGPDTLQDLAVRSETTIAPQALLLLNGAQVRQYAAALAAKIQPSAGAAVQDAIRAGYLRAIGRAPTETELQTVEKFLAAQTAAHGKQHPQALAAQLAWTDLCQALFCLNEFVYIE